MPTSSLFLEDLTILKDYRDGKIIPQSDEMNVGRLASIGLIKLGTDVKVTNSKIRLFPTAKTTPLGKKLLRDCY